jgi:hypothetical protein
MARLRRGEASWDELKVRFKPRKAGRCRPRRGALISRELKSLCTIIWGEKAQDGVEIEVCLKGAECERVTQLMVKDLSKVSL